MIGLQFLWEKRGKRGKQRRAAGTSATPAAASSPDTQASSCPSPGDLEDFAYGKSTDDQLNDHVVDCPMCRSIVHGMKTANAARYVRGTGRSKSKHAGYTVVRGNKGYGPYSQSQLSNMIAAGRVSTTDWIKSLASGKRYSVGDAARALKVSMDTPAAQIDAARTDGEIKNNEWGQFTATDSQAWTYVFEKASGLLDGINRIGSEGMNGSNFAKVVAQVNAIKRLAGKWLNSQEKRSANESIEAARQSIFELRLIKQFVLQESGNLARRQARLLRLQTRKLLDAQRDDQKQEIARGPFVDAVRAEQEGSEGKDKDK